MSIGSVVLEGLKWKKKIFFNKLSNVGFSIMDISKTYIYDFYYNYIKRAFGSNAIIVYR